MIVVTTPAGNIGAPLVRQLLARNEAVRVIARDPEKLDPDVRPHVELIRGSHDDASTLERAFEGADRVFWVVPPDPRAQDVSAYYRGFVQPAAQALLGQGVRQLVWVTTLAQEVHLPAGLLTAALEMDDMFRTTGIHARALQMPFFMENLLSQASAIAQGEYSLLNDAQTPLLTVATADIAQRAAELLIDPAWTGQDDVPVVGPDNLTPDGMAEVLSQVLGRPVQYRQNQPAAFVAMLAHYGVSDAWAQGLVEMAGAQDQGFYGTPPQTAPTSFRAWCEAVLYPALPQG